MQNAIFKMQMLRPARPCRSALFAFCILNFALLGASGCAKVKAASVPDGPPLAVPAPPARVIPTVEDVAAAPPTPAPEPAAPRPPAGRAPAPVASQPPPPAPAAEPREVRAGPSAAAAAEERKVREVMARAARALERVNYQRLSAAGQSQYNQSKRFSEQAEQAIKERNYVYAMSLADKAATLAAELAGR